MTNCYKILGVKDFASPEEIKIAYRKLSKKLHPDVNDGDKFFEERFKELQNAYEILWDSRKKEIHDNKLKNFFSDSNNFDFREKNKPENNEHTDVDKTNSQNNKSTNEREEGESTNAQTSSIPKSSKGKANNYTSVGIGASLFIILIIVIVAISSRTRKGLDDYSSNSSQKYALNYNPNQSIQTPSYQGQDLNSSETEKKYEDMEANQTYEVNNNYFTVGSTKNEVLNVQGNPTGVNKYEAIEEEVWNYGFSTVTFKNGRVSEFSNISRNLNAKMVSSNPNRADYFTIGSSKDDVLAAQGNPTGIKKYEAMGEEVWNYEFSSITFKHGRVSEFSNISKNLQAKMTNSIHSSGDYFSVGSTKNEVLEAQGNPSGIKKYEALGEEVWSFDFSTVIFKNGHVSEFSNISKNLNVRY